VSVYILIVSTEMCFSLKVQGKKKNRFSNWYGQVLPKGRKQSCSAKM